MTGKILTSEMLLNILRKDYCLDKPYSWLRITLDYNEERISFEGEVDGLNVDKNNSSLLRKKDEKYETVNNFCEIYKDIICLPKNVISLSIILYAKEIAVIDVKMMVMIKNPVLDINEPIFNTHELDNITTKFDSYLLEDLRKPEN